MRLFQASKYPEAEHGLVRMQNEFFFEWRKTVYETYGYDEAVRFESIVTDGVYPFYSNQKTKVLFIGRESLNIEGLNYIEILSDCYRDGRVGDKHLNSAFFHNRMFYITYALNNDLHEWSKLPYARELTDQFACKDGFSFACINLSKFSNCSGNWNADWKTIDEFVDKFGSINGINYINEQIKIIDPDLIITMNFGKNRIGHLGNSKVVSKSKNVNHYSLEVGQKEVKLFDTYHFSAPGKSSKRDFFEPIIELYKSIDN